jgi:hypothetical protein
MKDEGNVVAYDPPASALLERRPLKQEGSKAHPVNGSSLCRESLIGGEV